MPENAKPFIAAPDLLFRPKCHLPACGGQDRGADRGRRL